ncbi:MAG: exo-alpha-sialidase [Thermoguttaceae bacterium]|nr:exo-alpha-sialidase [Thermoguttaceae bacterium]
MFRKCTHTVSLFFGILSGIVSGTGLPLECLCEEMEPICMTVNDLTRATGDPSIQLMSNGSTHIPIWSLSGKTSGQSVAGIIPNLPKNCAAVKIEILVTTNERGETEQENTAPLEDVYRVHLSQMASDGPFTSGYVCGTPVRTPLPPEPFRTRTIQLETRYPVDPSLPLTIRIQREPSDPADTFTRPVGLAAVRVTPLPPISPAHTVQDAPGYNSWPVMQSLGSKLVCVYSRGTAHSIGEGKRGVYARTSTDGGKTWTPEMLVVNAPEVGEVTIGKGLDENGAMLLWVRNVGPQGFSHDLYRSTDGVHFTHLVRPELDPMPIQITDVFSVPGTGLMALWFAGKYSDDANDNSWGTLVSTDNGATWTQNVVEKGLTKADWPTEQSAVFLGDGKILAIGRTEFGENSTNQAQFQLTSTDSGKTWTRSRTNIGEVRCSTPSLILDPKTGLLSNYYYHRGRGILLRRSVKPDDVFTAPLNWPAPEAVAEGSTVTFDSGNVNAVVLGNDHALAYYSGKFPDTAVVVKVVAPPSK